MTTFLLGFAFGALFMAALNFRALRKRFCRSRSDQDVPR